MLSVFRHSVDPPKAAKSLRVAIIGCGAISERQHQPSLLRRGIQPSLLVDANVERARRLTAKASGTRVATDYRDCLGTFDAAIVALPHNLHASVCTDLLRSGVHVLVEKPMALTTDDCDQMIAAAAAGRTVLAVGLIRRFVSSIQWVKGLLENGALGRIESFDFQEGHVFDWPVTSDFFFRRESAGGGVLMDTGVHVLDVLLWLLGDVASLQYRDDSYGGVEADCVLDLTLESGARGVVELSRTRKLRNTARIRGEGGEVEFELPGNLVQVHPTSLLSVRVGGQQGSSLREQSYDDWFRLQLDDWLTAITTGSVPTVSGREGKRSIALIDACYGKRERLEFPWIGREDARHAISI
jgi:predicted dehydrogenase